MIYVTKGYQKKMSWDITLLTIDFRIAVTHIPKNRQMIDEFIPGTLKCTKGGTASKS